MKSGYWQPHPIGLYLSFISRTAKNRFVGIVAWSLFRCTYTYLPVVPGGQVNSVQYLLAPRR